MMKNLLNWNRDKKGILFGVGLAVALMVAPVVSGMVVPAVVKLREKISGIFGGGN